MLARPPNPQMHAPLSISDPIATRTHFDRAFPALWRSLCQYGPTYNKENVWFKICAGKAFLFTHKNSAVVGELIDHPIGFRSFNYWLQGGELGELKEMHAPIEAWAREQGCVRVMGIGRDGWSRAMHGDWHKGQTTRWKWIAPVPACAKVTPT